MSFLVRTVHVKVGSMMIRLECIPLDALHVTLEKYAVYKDDNLAIFLHEMQNQQVIIYRTPSVKQTRSSGRTWAFIFSILNESCFHRMVFAKHTFHLNN